MTAERRTALASLAATLLLVAGLGACGGPGSAPSAEPSAGASAPAAARPAERLEHVASQSVAEAPKIPDETALASVSDRTGSHTLPISGGLTPGPVSVMVVCQGAGTLTVTLEPTGLGFPLDCVAHESSTTYNQIGLRNARPEASVKVDAPAGVRWSLSVAKPQPVGG
ncbi:hypothetical protein ACIA8O_02825 [Kitasatospora sp. NPDC051853]|uniref:hypothetical protein n=1 Tax=Kitasatospora sp. NPDC051853 TaxID=3364058 RepID=UPI00379748C9